MKKIVFALLTVLCLLVMAGCGGSKETVSDAKVLRVGTDPQSPPFELYLEEQKEYTGFDVDLINDLAQHMGYSKVEFVRTPYSELLAGLNDNKYDVAMYNFSLTEERSREYAPSNAYAKAGFSVVASEKALELDLKGDFSGKKIAVMAKTSAERFAKEFAGALIVGYPSYESALHAVSTGEADYAICGNLTAAYIMTHTSKHGLKVVGHSEKQDEIVFYMNKNNSELQKKLNDALSECKKSGEYKKLIEFYFGDIEKQ